MSRSLAAIFAALTFVCVAGPSVAANKSSDAQAIVDKAKGTIESFAGDPEMQWFRENMGQAKAIIVVPSLVKAGFIFGGSGGTGVMLARDPSNGTWSYPAFYTIGSATFGLQIGGEVAEIILMVMTERGKDSLLTTDIKLGGDVSVAAGPVGAGAKAQTTDILAFSRTKGLYGGLNVEGAVVKVRNALNEAYYKRGVRPRDILVSRNVANSKADALRSAVAALVR